MDQFWNSMTDFCNRNFNISPDRFAQIFWTIVTLLVYFIVRRVVVRLCTRRLHDIERKYVATKTITYLFIVLTAVGLVRIWVGGITSLATYLGLLSAGVAITLQEPLSNLAGWFYIVLAKPFVTSDRVDLNGRAGDVIDVRLFQFTINEIDTRGDADQSTGRIIHMPNNWVFKHACINYTQGFNFIWNELPVTVTYESNWAKAREILLRVAETNSAVHSELAAQEIRKAAEKFLIHYDKLTPIVWTQAAESGVTLTVRYLCAPRNRRSSASNIWEQILTEFAACDDIDLAYRTVRSFNNVVEGKPGARATPPGMEQPKRQ